jgi:hypothetical protein
MNTKRINFLIRTTLLLILILIIGFYRPITTPFAQQKLADNKDLYWLIQTGKMATIKYNNGDHAYKLIMHQINNSPTGFLSLSCKTKSHLVTTKNVIKSWNKLAPDKNAGLEAELLAQKVGDNKTVTYAVSIKNPTYQDSTQTMSFDMSFAQQPQFNHEADNVILLDQPILILKTEWCITCSPP